MGDRQSIRFTRKESAEKRGGPVEVCEHIDLSNAYTDARRSYEYSYTVAIYCEECDAEHRFKLKVN